MTHVRLRPGRRVGGTEALSQPGGQSQAGGWTEKAEAAECSFGNELRGWKHGLGKKRGFRETDEDHKHRR